MADLFTPEQLGDLVQGDISPNTAETVRAIITDLWLGETRRSAVPDAIPAGAMSWALGIAARVLDNPSGRSQEGSGVMSAGFGQQVGLQSAIVLSEAERRACRRWRVGPPAEIRVDASFPTA